MPKTPEIRVPATAFQDAFRGVAVTIERKNILPILSCVRLRTTYEGQLELTGMSSAGQITDLVNLLDDSAGDIDICIPAEKLAPIALSTHDSITIKPKEAGRVIVSTDRSRATLPSLDGADFPTMEVAEQIVAEFDSPGLGKLIESVAFVADERDIRDYCQGVWMESDGQSVQVVATDVKMMAVNQLTIAVPQFGFMLREKSAGLIAELDPERILVTDDAIIAERGSARLVVKKALHKFPDWRRVLPELNNSVTFRAEELRNAIGMHRVYDHKLGAVQFVYDDGYLARIKDTEHEADFELSAIGDDIDTSLAHAFKGDQLAKMLAHIVSENVTIFWNGKKPVGFLMQEGTWRGIVSCLNI
ncbi:hypothetical protein [Burkholderia gladioli]|uniref:hypothetical protein n=1 Tax=Burkholderia gladioli TaxID=28095 RepID=UPI0016412F7F|nr:hypothetical protein [Burkholderia gladioli]